MTSHFHYFSLVELIVLNIGHDAGVLNDQGKQGSDKEKAHNSNFLPSFCNYGGDGPGDYNNDNSICNQAIS